MNDVATTRAFLHLLDDIEGEAAPQPLLDRQLQHFALQLLGALLHLALRRRQLRHGVIQLLLQFRLVQLRLFLFLGARRRFAFDELGVDLPVNLQGQGLLFITQPLPLLAQRQLLVPQLLQLRLTIRQTLLVLTALVRHQFRRLFRRRLVDPRVDGLLAQHHGGFALVHRRQRLGMRLRLCIEDFPQFLDLTLGGLGLFAGELLGTLLDRRAFLILQLRQSTGTGAHHRFQGLPRKALLQRELVVTGRTCHPGVRGQQ